MVRCKVTRNGRLGLLRGVGKKSQGYFLNGSNPITVSRRVTV